MIVLKTKLSTIIVHTGEQADWQEATNYVKANETATNSCLLVCIADEMGLAEAIRVAANNDVTLKDFAQWLAMIYRAMGKGPGTFGIALQCEDVTLHCPVEVAVSVTYHDVEDAAPDKEVSKSMTWAEEQEWLHKSPEPAMGMAAGPSWAPGWGF